MTLRKILLWWRAKGCYHKTAPSLAPQFLGMAQCDRCGTVFLSDGKKFVRAYESIIELEPNGRVISITQPV